MAVADKQTSGLPPPPPRAWTAKPKGPRGRPSKRSQERDEGIILAILVGFNLKATAAANGITYQTLNAWLKEDPGFAALVKRARANAEQARTVTLKRAEQRKQKSAAARRTNENVDAKSYYDEYFSELHRIVSAQEHASNRTRLAAALARHGLKIDPPRS